MDSRPVTVYTKQTEKIEKIDGVNCNMLFGAGIMKALELQKVYLRRGDFLLHDIAFDIEVGSVVALSGRSGAGKSSLIRLIGNAFTADAGRILYFGKEMYEAETEIRKRMSVIYDAPNFNIEMRAGKLAKEIKRFEPWFSMEEFHQHMERLGLDETKHVKQFSKGMQKKYMLVLALCRKPDLLVMDELTSGTDETSRKEMLQLIAEYRKEQMLTVFFSTHNKNDLEDFAERVLVIENGGMQ